MDNKENPNSGSEEVRPRTSRLMTLSIVLGVVDHIVFLGLIGSARSTHHLPPDWLLLGQLLIAPVVGIVAIAQIWLSRGRIRGPMGVLGFLGAWLLMAFMLAVVFPTFQNPRASEKLPQSVCVSNMKQLGLAILQYTQDYDNKLPSGNWNSALSDYIKSDAVFRCPSEEDQTRPSYAMNVKAMGLNVKQAKHAEELVVVFESVPGWNLVGGPGVLPREPRHSGGENYCFGDGHVKWYRREDGVKLRWEPKEEVPHER